jgi:transposase
MPRSGPRTIYKYSKEFKLAAVRLSHTPEMQVKTVAEALGIHPFMLSKWRKEVRDGVLRGRLPKTITAGPARELARLQQLEREHALLQAEHDLLKKAIRFCASRKRTPSRSSTPSAPRTVSRGSAGASA